MLSDKIGGRTGLIQDLDFLYENFHLSLGLKCVLIFVIIAFRYNVVPENKLLCIWVLKDMLVRAFRT